MSGNYLVIMIEPTPYVVGLMRELSIQLQSEIDLFFVTQNNSQNWNISLANMNAQVLPNTFYSAAKLLFRQIMNKQYQVIYGAGWGELIMKFIFLVAWIYRIPLIVESDTQLIGSSAGWKRFLKTLFYPLFFKIPAMMLPFGSRQADYFRHYGVEEDRITIINYTSDVNHVKSRCAQLGMEGRAHLRNRLAFGERDIVFNFTGRLYDFKGVDVLVKSFKEVAAKYGHVRLLIVGDGPEKQMVMDAAECNEKIKYVGRLEFDNAIEMYHASDVAVLPSRRDAFGLVVHESMAAGLPVIATDGVGCVDDLINWRDTGIVVAADDVLALANAMKTVVNNPILLAEMSANGKRLISQWTLQNTASIICGVMNKLGQSALE